MSQADRNANYVEPVFHPISHYVSPDDVLNDASLSTDEKRVILSSWASDIYVVESHPALREVPGIPHSLRLDDILAALKQLGDENETASEQPQRIIGRHTATSRYRSMPASGTPSGSRWTREANVRRYRKLLNTQLTDLERSFIERRLAEELQG
jgi:hypothetical protein